MHLKEISRQQSTLFSGLPCSTKKITQGFVSTLRSATCIFYLLLALLHASTKCIFYSPLSYTSIIPWNEWLYTFSIKLEITIPNLVLNHWHKASREKYSLCQYFLLRNNLIKAISSEQSTQAPLKEGRYTLYRRNCIKKTTKQDTSTKPDFL